MASDLESSFSSSHLLLFLSVLSNRDFAKPDCWAFERAWGTLVTNETEALLGPWTPFLQTLLAAPFGHLRHPQPPAHSPRAGLEKEVYSVGFMAAWAPHWKERS